MVPQVDSAAVAPRRTLTALLFVLLLLPAVSTAGSPADDLLQAPSADGLIQTLIAHGLTLDDLAPGWRDAVNRGLTTPIDGHRLASADALLASPTLLPGWAEERATRLAKDVPPVGGLPGWTGLFGLAFEELGIGAPEHPCAAELEPYGLIDHHIAWEAVRGVRLSKREIKGLREQVDPALDERLGRLVSEAEVARCGIDAALTPLAPDQRAGLVQAVAALLDGLAPGTAEAEAATATLTGAWDTIDAAGLMAVGRGWSEAVSAAAAELAALPPEAWPSSPMIFPTLHGEVWIGSAAHNSGTGDPFLVVDPGGDDVWRIEPEAEALPQFGARTVRGWIDLGGDDLWHSGAAGVGGALLSVSAGVDAAGDDVMRTGALGAGAAAFGVATWLDTGGDDVRTGGVGAQGFAAFGIGALRDHGDGPDSYAAIDLAQGAALPLGIGVLHEGGGDDRMDLAGRDLAIPAHRAWPLSGGQGASLGLYPLLGGGLGWLQDETGDDVRTGADHVQGACSGHGIAVVIDGSGDDLWQARDGAQGASIDGGVALARDRSGDDRWVAADDAQASARRRAAALLIDLDGDDRYTAGTKAQAWAGWGSLTLLLDGGGGDSFTADSRGQGAATRSDGLSIGLLVEADVAGPRTVAPVALAIGELVGSAVATPTDAEAVATLVGKAASGRLSTARAVDGLAQAGLARLPDALQRVSDRRPAEASVVHQLVTRLGRAASAETRSGVAAAVADDALVRARGADDPSVRWHLTWLAGAAALHPVDAGEPALRAASALADHPAWRVRERALLVLQAMASIPDLNLDPADAEAWQSVGAIALQGDGDVEVRVAAALLLAEVGGPGVATILAELLQRGGARERDAASGALAAINRRTDGLAVARALFPLAAAEVEVRPVVRIHALRLLGATKHREAWDVIEPALADPSPQIRLAAIRGARELGGRQVERALAERLEVETDADVQQALAQP
jgi:hypothetical protein